MQNKTIWMVRAGRSAQFVTTGSIPFLSESTLKAQSMPGSPREKATIEAGADWLANDPIQSSDRSSPIHFLLKTVRRGQKL